MDMTQIGARLRSRRRELGRTIATVADQAELSMTYVANLERGRGNPTLDTLTALAEALEISLLELVGEDAAHDLKGAGSELATLDRSLVEFSRSELFEERLERLAERQRVSKDEMRRRLLTAMVAAPRRAKGELTRTDWVRLLDAYTMILD